MILTGWGNTSFLFWSVLLCSELLSILYAISHLYLWRNKWLTYYTHVFIRFLSISLTYVFSILILYQIFFKYRLPFCRYSFQSLGLAKRTFSLWIYYYISNLLPILALFTCDFEFLPKYLSPYRYFEVFYSVSLLFLMFGIFNLWLLRFALFLCVKSTGDLVSPVYTQQSHFLMMVTKETTFPNMGSVGNSLSVNVWLHFLDPQSDPIIWWSGFGKCWSFGVTMAL